MLFIISSQGNIQVSLTSMTVSLSGGGFLLRHRLESVQVTLRRKFTCRNYPRKQKIVTQPAVNPHLVVTFLVWTYLIITYFLHLQYFSFGGRGAWVMEATWTRQKWLGRLIFSDHVINSFFSFLYSCSQKINVPW